MKVYIAHSRDMNYQEDLYSPIRSAEELPQAAIILPHENSSHSKKSREFYAQLDLVIAEVSQPATGLGIEVGWAYDSEVPIVCIYKKGHHYSSSLHAVTDQFFEYDTDAELVKLIQNIINQLQPHHA